MSDARDRTFHLGCSGWNYAGWRHGVVYPERCPARLWLEYYARHFDTVEVNATFYRLPTVKAVQGWVDQTPDDFTFAVKMSRYVTHVKRLRHPSWFAPEVMDLMRAHGVAPVIGDPRPPQQLLRVGAARVGREDPLLAGRRGLSLHQQRLGGVRATERDPAARASQRAKPSLD